MGSREIGSNNFVQLERTHTDHTQTGRTAKLKRQEESRNLRETHPTAFESGSSRAEAGLATVAAPTARGGAGGRETPPAYNAITLRQADTLVASRPEATGANAHTVAAMFILGYKNEGGEFEFIGNADSHKAKHLVSTLGAARTSGNLKETLAQLADEGVLKEIQTVSVQCKDPELQRQLDKYLATAGVASTETDTDSDVGSETGSVASARSADFAPEPTTARPSDGTLEVRGALLDLNKGTKIGNMDQAAVIFAREETAGETFHTMLKAMGFSVETHKSKRKNKRMGRKLDYHGAELIVKNTRTSLTRTQKAKVNDAIQENLGDSTRTLGAVVSGLNNVTFFRDKKRTLLDHFVYLMAAGESSVSFRDFSDLLTESHDPAMLQYARKNDVSTDDAERACGYTKLDVEQTTGLLTALVKANETTDNTYIKSVINRFFETADSEKKTDVLAKFRGGHMGVTYEDLRAAAD